MRVELRLVRQAGGWAGAGQNQRSTLLATRLYQPTRQYCCHEYRNADRCRLTSVR